MTVPLPGFGAKRELRQVTHAVYELACRATELAGLTAPSPPSAARSADVLVRQTDVALDVLVERNRNDRREAQLRHEQWQAERVEWRRQRTEIALRLTDFRERLSAVGSSAQGADQDPLVWAVQHVDDALRSIGAEPFTDQGALDARRHRVVSSLPAGPGRAARTIASSTRPGLLVDGEVARPQEVVAYQDGPDDNL
ncbi:hypothetical protein [Symbioplanes lichenis]|uniref:hypothetical protein n=1 Tax=Symbioplanes lichenis TaxID=1629072 RepID=UPI00273A31BB|nr:hypothetical protein [Actinoplanes lichenis]